MFILFHELEFLRSKHVVEILIKSKLIIFDFTLESKTIYFIIFLTCKIQLKNDAEIFILIDSSFILLSKISLYLFTGRFVTSLRNVKSTS